MGDVQCRGAAAARRLAATALRDCTTRLDTSASLTNTVFFLPFSTPRATAPVTRTRVDTPREFYKNLQTTRTTIHYPCRPTTPNIIIYYTHITYLLCSMLMTAATPPPRYLSRGYSTRLRYI